MRRQARISGGGALVVRTASALQVWLWLLIFVFQNEFRISRSIQPGYLDFDNLPDTNFTCAGKVIGGYYADLETSCQMFHVCTVGQQDEPMDIKFLCLNGTVFDQETRVCERVDEVDCTKSEKFYNLNLELYGSTVSPIIQPEQVKPTEKVHDQNKHHSYEETDPSIDDSLKLNHEHKQISISDSIETTEEPHNISQDQEHRGQNNNKPTHRPPLEHITQHVEPVEENQEEEEENSEIPEYEDEYASISPTTTASPSTTTTTPSSTTTLRTTQTPIPRVQPTSHSPPSSIQQHLTPSSHPSPLPITTSVTSLDPALLSPQEFIYRHRGPGSEAISFQRQSFRPADGVYITHAPPQQFDHFQYESSRTAPRPVVSRPAPFTQRQHPNHFRATTIDPRDQLLRPGPSSQSSERHETTIKHRPPSYPTLTALPAQRPLPFDPFYFDRKRSDDLNKNTETSLTARSAIPPTLTERQPTKPKSPPRVIVTASASVSDSNGKRLNYTVGNVVSAVKPIVQINYDDYKESDLIFDPFFLDVPKLKKRRKTRANKGKIVTIPATTPTSYESLTSTTVSPGTPTITTPTSVTSKSSLSTTTTAAWNPNDYVDDNYEPHAYIPPVPPLSFLLPLERNKNIHDRQSNNNYVSYKLNENEKVKVSRMEQLKPTFYVARTHISSSQTPAVPVSPLADNIHPATASTACAHLHLYKC